MVLQENKLMLTIMKNNVIMAAKKIGYGKYNRKLDFVDVHYFDDSIIVLGSLTT